MIKKSVLRTAISVVISRSAWQGVALGGKNIYENGNMYWSGTIYGAILMPKGSARITIEAGGSPLGGVYPYMFVSLDGKRIGSAYVDSLDFKEYSFTADANDLAVNLSGRPSTVGSNS